MPIVLTSATFKNLSRVYRRGLGIRNRTDDAAFKAGYSRRCHLGTDHTAHGLPRHFQMTAHGVVMRTFLSGPGPLFTEIHRISIHAGYGDRAVYLGSVERAGDGFHARIPNGRLVAAETDYADAEAQLVSRQGRTSTYRIGREIVLPPEVVAACEVARDRIRSGDAGNS